MRDNIQMQLGKGRRTERELDKNESKFLNDRQGVRNNFEDCQKGMSGLRLWFVRAVVHGDTGSMKPSWF